MSADDEIFRPHAKGVDLRVRLTPGAGRDEISGIAASSDGRRHIAARVRAVPEKGAANTALERLVADWLDVPRSTVEVSGGGKSRLKTVTVYGDRAELASRMKQVLG